MSSSQSAGATAHGGLLVIDGNAGARCGISMKGVDIVVKGSIGHMSAFMAQAGTLTVDPDFKPGKGMAGAVTPCGEIFLLLGSLVDVDAVRARLTQERRKAREEITKAQAKLSSETFTARAPAEVVEEHRQRVTDFTAKSAQLTELLDNLN